MKKKLLRPNVRFLFAMWFISSLSLPTPLPEIPQGVEDTLFECALDGFSNVKKVTDPRGNVTESFYDVSKGNLLATRFDEHTLQRWDDVSNSTVLTNPCAKKTLTKTEYDFRGSVLKTFSARVRNPERRRTCHENSHFHSHGCAEFMRN